MPRSNAKARQPRPRSTEHDKHEKRVPWPGPGPASVRDIGTPVHQVAAAFSGLSDGPASIEIQASAARSRGPLQREAVHRV